MGHEAQASLFGAPVAAVSGAGESGFSRGDEAKQRVLGTASGCERTVGKGQSRGEGGLAVVARHKVSTKAAGGLLALGRMKAGQQNKTEAAYEATLRAREVAGEIVWYRFEGLKLRLADSTFYTPDYAVMLASGQIECHEVKGRWMDDARAKIKIAAEMYPFRFLAVFARAKKDGGGWDVEVFE